MSKTTFLYSEKLVAEQLGLTRKIARDLRGEHLTEEVDWRPHPDNGAIMLSERGVSVISHWIDKPVPNLELCVPEKKNGGGLQQMLVVAVPMNPRMVLASESGDAGAERFLVDVGNNKNLRIGDPLLVGPHDVQKGVLRCLTKLPRNSRRPSFCGSARDPNNWGQREMNAMVERARRAGK